MTTDADGGPVARHPRLALLALALGGFAIGSTEFVALGLLPDIAADLLPGLWRSSHARAVAQAGVLASAYAAGVVVGAPTIAAFAARLPRKRLLLGLLGAIVVATALSAVLPTFGLVVAARFVSGLPHGAYFGVASLVAAEVLGPNSRGRAAASVLAGLTVANLAGVPFITFVGQTAGWRAAYGMVTLLFVATFAAVLAVVPALPGDPDATAGAELRAFARGQVWLTLVMGAIGFGGLFAVYTYVAPLATSVTGLPRAVVPLVLIVFGAGMTLGNLTGGLLIDRNVQRAVVAFFSAVIAALAFLDLTVRNPVGLFVGVFAIGAATSALAPAMQVRLQDAAPDSRTIAAALNHSSLNIGNALGAALGGAVIAAGFGYVAPIQVGLVLSVAGLAIALASFGLERRTRRASASA